MSSLVVSMAAWPRRSRTASVGFDLDREGGEAAVTLDFFGGGVSASSMPAAVLRRHISPEDQCWTFAVDAGRL